MFVGESSPIFLPNVVRLLRGGSGPAGRPPLPPMETVFMGRDAIGCALRELGIGRGETVLLPGYLCREVLLPAASAADVAFYDVERDLSIDVQKLRARLDRTAARALLVIHYFGFLHANIAQVAEECTRRGVLLIEDCAQAMLTPGCGGWGDAAVYSLRKLLPLPDGGGYHIRNRRAGETAARRKPRLAADALSLAIMVKAGLRIDAEWLSRGAIEKKMTGASAEKGKADRDGAGPPAVYPMSHVSSRILRALDIGAVVQARRRNFSAWLELQGRIRCKPLFRELPEGVCPLGFPVLIGDRDRLVAEARRRGLRLKVHWHLPAEVDASCATAWRLSREMVTLPVYPELGEKELDFVAGTIAAIQEERRAEDA